MELWHLDYVVNDKVPQLHLTLTIFVDTPDKVQSDKEIQAWTRELSRAADFKVSRL